MTTIACDGKTIAGDGQLMNGSFVHSLSFVKVHPLKDGSVMGFAGNAYDLHGALAFLNGEAEAFEGGASFEAIILSPSGDCRGMDCKGRFIPLPPPCATGCGEQIAITAMRCGKTAVEAIEMACQYNIGTGGQVTFATPGAAA